MSEEQDNFESGVNRQKLIDDFARAVAELHNEFFKDYTELAIGAVVITHIWEKESRKGISGVSLEGHLNKGELMKSIALTMDEVGLGVRDLIAAKKELGEMDVKVNRGPDSGTKLNTKKSLDATDALNKIKNLFGK